VGEVVSSNTLVFADDGKIVADNTDAPALIAALPFDARDQTAVVLGAGGSARAVVWALVGAGARRVVIWNRSPLRASALADELDATALSSSESLPTADILVNCTSVGLDGGDPFGPLPLAADHLSNYRCVVDLVYTPAGTRLIDTAADAGTATVDGLEILVGQGALSFEQFTGLPAPLDVMRAAARG
jgi:shikimate dehydrogenase